MKIKVDVFVALFCYGGNGGVATLIPEIALWLLTLQKSLLADDRIGRVGIRRYGDVPLTMERNRVARDAIEGGFDVLVMIDSDNQPDLYLNHRKTAKPFWDSSFEFAFERLRRNIPTVVCSPYCGPPQHPTYGGQENVYVFHALTDSTGHGDQLPRFEAFSRTHAAQMSGIQEIAAGPTGVILITTNAFDLLQFDRRPPLEILADFRAGSMDAEKCLRELRKQSYFFYEFTDGWQSRKASTEDVTFTREIQCAGHIKFGEPVVFCNWDAWAGHWKPWCVGAPSVIPMEAISAIFQEAVLSGQHVGEEMRDVDFTKNNPALQRMINTLPGQGDPEDDFDPDAPETTDPDLRKNGDNGVEIKARMICGRKAFSVGHVTPDGHLDALTMLAKHMGTLRGNRPLRMLEVGSWVGESALALIGGAPPNSEIFCVDTWEGSPTDWTRTLARIEPPFEWFVKNTEDLLGHQIKPVRGESVDVAQSFDDPQDLDLVFIDGDHSYDECRADIHAWIHHVAPNGILCGHDYGVEQLPGVKQAVDQFAEEYGIQVSVIADTSIWFLAPPQIVPKATPPNVPATAPPSV